jgi:phosphatidylglycerol---prolipoprotein diacylglyceryl transferase
MHPILFTIRQFHVGGTPIGPIQIHSFSVMLIIAFLLGVWIARKRAPRFGFDPGKISDASMLALFAGVLGARVLFVVQELPYYLEHRDELFSLQFQGLTSFGGLLFGFLAYWYFAWRQRRPVREVLDVVAPSGLLGFGIGRIGCLLNGCCYGVVCSKDYPLAVHVDATATVHIPAQLFDALMCFAALGLLLWIEKRRKLHSGQVFALFIGFYGISRFVYEFWRAGTIDEVKQGIASSTRIEGLPITEAQVVALALVLVAVVMFLVCQRHPIVNPEVASPPQENVTPPQETATA